MGNSDDDFSNAAKPRNVRADSDAANAKTRKSLDLTPNRAKLMGNAANLYNASPFEKDRGKTFEDMNGPPDPYDENLSGMRIAENYEILDKVGEGGMSAVYRARHMHLNREVAVKMLHPHLIANRISRERFSQEARAVSQIEHPHVVRLLDFGITEENRPYIVMDFLRGQALSQRIKGRGPLAVDDAVPIFLQICDALSYTHQKGIVHRDLKPSNVILLEKRSAEGTEYSAKIVDFGIAKLSPLEDSGVAGLTQTGDVFGSPLYMSPEQARGEKLDNRADVYSMGCLMYETLTGVPPINGTNMLEILYRHMNEMPQPMHTVARDREIPRVLEAIVFKALAKDPKERYQDMDSLALDLTNFSESSEGFLESIKTFWSLYRSRRKRLTMREKIATGLSATAALAFLTCIVAFSIFYIRGTQDLSEQELTWLKPRHEGKIDTLYGDKAQLIYFAAAAGKSRAEELHRLIDKGQTILPTDEDYDRVQNLMREAAEMRQQGDLVKAGEQLVIAADLSTMVHGYDSIITRQILNLKLMTLYDTERYKEALELLETMRRNIPEPVLYARSDFKAVFYSIAGECKFFLKRYEEARSDLLEALTNWDSADQDPDRKTSVTVEMHALALSYFADTFFLDGMWEEASKYYGQAANVWKGAPSPRNDYNEALALYKQSLCACHLKDEKKAEQFFSRAQNILHHHPKDFIFYQAGVQMTQISAKLDQQEGFWLPATQKYIQVGLAKNKGEAVTESEK